MYLTCASSGALWAAAAPIRPCAELVEDANGTRNATIKADAAMERGRRFKGTPLVQAG